jgi:hypothetical protein
MTDRIGAIESANRRVGEPAKRLNGESDVYWLSLTVYILLIIWSAISGVPD